jgi:hypothetical protein
MYEMYESFSFLMAKVRETDGEPIFAPRSDTFADEPPFRFVQ